MHRFADDILAVGLFFSQLAIGFQDELDRLLQIHSCLFQSRTLSVGSRQFFNESDVAFRYFSENLC